MIDQGQKFPDFNLPNQDGKMMTLNSFKGKWLVVYIYPKDDTPGCTIQGKSFTSSKDDFDAAEISVVGLSPDNVASHKDFCNKFSFNFDLLADTDAKLLTALGAGQTDWKGTMFWNRTSFVVDPIGVVRKIYTAVKPEGHEQVLLQDIKELQSAKR